MPGTHQKQTGQTLTWDKTSPAVPGIIVRNHFLETKVKLITVLRKPKNMSLCFIFQPVFNKSNATLKPMAKSLPTLNCSTSPMSKFVRKGEVGDWKNYVSEKQNKYRQVCEKRCFQAKAGAHRKSTEQCSFLPCKRSKISSRMYLCMCGINVPLIQNKHD